MIKLSTSVERPSHSPSIGYQHRLMLLGSCFTTNIGAKLAAAKFCCDINPYGVLYNPLSIATALREMAAGKVYTVDDLYAYQVTCMPIRTCGTARCITVISRPLRRKRHWHASMGG